MLWVATRPDSEAAERFAAAHMGRLVAPATLLLEVHYALAKLVLRRLALGEQLANAVPLLSRAVSIVPLDEALSRTAAAISLGAGGAVPINIYDCTYVALALETGEALVTVDARQASIASGLGLTVLPL